MTTDARLLLWTWRSDARTHILVKRDGDKKTMLCGGTYVAKGYLRASEYTGSRMCLGCEVAQKKIERGVTDQ